MKRELKITLILSLLGILILIFIVGQMPPKKMTIVQITTKEIGQDVELQGKIIGLREFPAKSFQILTIEDYSGQMTATANSKIMLKINNSQEYIFIGKIEEYNKTLQLKLDKIKMVNDAF
jgi:hypothetical protein